MSGSIVANPIYIYIYIYIYTLIVNIVHRRVRGQKLQAMQMMKDTYMVGKIKIEVRALTHNVGYVGPPLLMIVLKSFTFGVVEIHVSLDICAFIISCSKEHLKKAR